jgi:hypothetical protein
MGSGMDRGVLWARAVLLASVTVFLGTAGHVTADGLLPGPAAMVLLYAVAVVGAVAFLARPATAPRLVVLLVGGQTLVHLVLSAAAGHAGDAATAAAARAGGLALPTVDGRRTGSLLDAYDAGATHAASPALPVGHLLEHLTQHGPMMAAHLVVAVLVGLWLAVGERALFTLIALAVRVAGARLRPLPVRRRPVLPAAAPAVPLFSSVLARAVVRRGPPVVA